MHKYHAVDCLCRGCSPSFFFNDTATTEIYTLSLHDALPICVIRSARATRRLGSTADTCPKTARGRTVCSVRRMRSEEHTSELQSQSNLVCRLLLEKKKTVSDLRLAPCDECRTRAF